MQRYVLIGFSGCGKSTTGRFAAKALDLPFDDSDKEIERLAGCSISEIFAQKGEAKFRALETEAITKLLRRPRGLIATGGGCVTVERNMRIIGQSATVIYLRATPEKILSNVGHDTTRPLLQTDDKMAAIRQLMDARLPLYEKYAHITIDVSNLTRPEAVDALVVAIKRA